MRKKTLVFRENKSQIAGGELMHTIQCMIHISQNYLYSLRAFMHGVEVKNITNSILLFFSLAALVTLFPPFEYHPNNFSSKEFILVNRYSDYLFPFEQREFLFAANTKLFNCQPYQKIKLLRHLIISQYFLEILFCLITSIFYYFYTTHSIGKYFYIKKINKPRE